jgi:hypothetical protein
VVAATNWIQFEGYEGRLDPDYGGAYSAPGLRYPYVDRNRTWDIVRVDGEPTGGMYRRGQFTLLSRGHDMMRKAHEEAAAYRLHFKRCAGVGICEEMGHPGGPKRSRAQALGPDAAGPSPSEVTSPGATATAPALASADRPPKERPDDWIAALMPAGDIQSRVVGDGLELRVIPLLFDLWQGPQLHMQDDCRKRGGRVIGDRGELSCAEVEIVKRLRSAGWDAAWFQSFKCGRRSWSAYIRDEPDLPAVVRRVQLHAGAAGGHPDVIGWLGDRVLAIESKSRNDRLKPSQIEWFRRARAVGVAPDDLAVVEWRVRG